MPRCLTKLNSNTQQASLDFELFMSDFSEELEKYYKGAEKAPSIDLLVSEINTLILPQFLSGSYGIDDVLETIQDPENALAINSAFSKLLTNRRQLNLKANLPSESYATDRKFDLVDELVKSLGGSIAENKASNEERIEQASSVNDAVVLESMTPSLVDDYVHERDYENLRAYRINRFKGSSSIENLTVGKFVTDVFLKNVFIDVEARKLVDQKRVPNQISEIDSNLKNYRINLLKDMIDRLNIQDTVNGEVKKLEFTNKLLTYKDFQRVLRLIADKVMNVKYNGEQVSLEKDTNLFEITEEYKRTQHEELKEIVDNFIDYVILSDFNKLFDYYGEGAIDINKFNDDFNMALNKYSAKNALSLDALNAHWDEQIQNGVDLASPLYKTIINHTPLLNYTTGADTGKFLYPTLVASTFSPYFDLVDRYNATESIREILMEKLRATGISRTEKNVLYTLYKKFFEREGDAPVVELKSDKRTPKRNNNTEVVSFYETIKNNRDQSLMLLISKPLVETSKSYLIEAVEGFNQGVTLSIAEPRSKTAVDFTSTRFTLDNINKSADQLFGTDAENDKGFIAKWNIKFVHTAGKDSIVTYTGKNGIDYELKSSDNKVYDIDTIKQLSKDLLGLDFNNDRRHMELWEELQSLADGDGQIPAVYLAYMKDAFDIVEAKVKLYEPEFAAMLRDLAADNAEIVTGYSIIDEAIRNDIYFNLKNPTVYKFKLNNQNAKAINELVYTAENNFTGNQLKSVQPTVEGTTVASYSIYNYSAAIKQNLYSHKNLVNSAVKGPIDNSPLHNNIFMNDVNALERFYIRGAAKVGTTVKGNTKQTDYETMHFNINLAYFGRLKQATSGNQPAPIFDITVYSDKGQNPLPAVNNEILLPTGRVKLFVDDNGLAVDEQHSINLLYQTSGQYYRAYGQNILDTWEAVYRASGHGSVFEEQVKGKSVSEKLTALNAIQGNFWNGNFEHSLKGYDAARYYASKAGVALVNWVHFDNSAKNLGPKTKLTIKPVLIENIARFDKNPNVVSAGFKEKYETQLVKFAKEMREMDFKFDAAARNVITKLYPNLGPEFGHEDDIYLTSYNKVPTSASDIHPALRKFFYDYNLVQDNLMNVTVGPIYAHKGTDENVMWLTQNKRNVAFTASVRNYSLGLEDGVEDSTRTAFVDDLVSYAKTILGDTHQVVDFDGASFETMTQRIKTWNSLNARFNGDGGIVHKSFISHFDPKTGYFGETKHAAFAMTNDMIRQSQGSAMDLMELHKQLYATDISTVDITNSWKDGVNLKSFDDVYYFKRELDFGTGLMGTMFKLDGIKYVGKSVDGRSLYEISTRNLSLSPDKVDVSPMPVHINTMFELWQILGGIDSVEHSDEKTNFFYFDPSGKTKIYVTDQRPTRHGYMPVATSAMKLLDFESYIGNKGETIIPEGYLKGDRNAVRRGYNAYKQLFDENGVVSSQLALIKKWVNSPINSTLEAELKQFNVKETNFEAFVHVLKTNADDLQDLVAYIEDNQATLERVMKPYQRFKGKNIDRISFAGAQKVGQFNLNNIETMHLKKRAEYLANKGLPADPGIDGVTKLITHQISNFNAGIQLNAWHETENAEVTTPTQMLNALVFNAKKLGKVQQMYSAIGNIVDQELTYLLAKDKENIPQLVRGLSNREFYTTNKDKLLAIFKDIMTDKVNNSRDGEFTLEGIIVEMFNHVDFPVDDSQIFSSAIAELTNYFTKTGIRTKFDGLFAVLAPGSNVLQIHDVQGGFVPVKNNRGGFEIKALEVGVSRIMRPAEYAEYKRLNEWLAINDPNEDIRNHAKTAELNDAPRNLKGQQVKIRLRDGSLRDLSILNDGETHLIPEAKALDHAKRAIEDFKDVLGGDDYKKLDEAGKIKFLAKKHKEFLARMDSLASSTNEDGTIKNPEIRYVLDTFEAELKSVMTDKAKIKGHILNFIYETFSQSKAARDEKIKALMSDPNSKELRYAKEHEYFDKLNSVGQLFTGRLQKFLDEADRGYVDQDGQVSYIPASLRNPELFEDADKLLDAKIEVSRAECIAPIVASKAFLLRPGDNVEDITQELFEERLLDTLDYFDVNADAVILSKHGKRIFLHEGSPTPGTKANEPHPRVVPFRNKRWFTNESGDRIFQIPDDMMLTNINGNLHVFFNNNPEYELINNPLTRSLELGLGKYKDEFSVEILGAKELRAERKAVAATKLADRAQRMYSSWQVYVNKLIGTRVPGQHFQSFQGMKIVGFSEGNNITVANEVILLSGADFDIDKQNIIYHSINEEGVLDSWHKAFDYTSKETLLESLKLPMPSNRTAADFTAELSPTGEAVDQLIPVDDDIDLTNVAALNGIYQLLEDGYRLHPEDHANIIAQLVDFEDLSVPINGVKNFAVSSTNQIIESSANFLYLSNGVSTDRIKQFSNRTAKAAIASNTAKENPHSQSIQKETNMVGRQGIGIMASHMKALSAITYTTNTTLKQISSLYVKRNRLAEILQNYDYHLNAMHDPDKFYSGGHTQQELEEASRLVNTRLFELDREVRYLINAIGGDRLTLPNINYDLLSDIFEGPLEASNVIRDSNVSPLEGEVSNLISTNIFASLHRTSKDNLVNPNKKLSWAKLAQMFDTDIADLDSQMLSSSTDNAKELDLGKINAIPALMAIFPTMGLNNQSFEEMVDLMTSPLVEMLLRNATKNVYDRNTSKNSIGNLLNAVNVVAKSESEEAIAKAMDKLELNYNLVVTNGGVQDLNTRDIYSYHELIDFNDRYFKPAQMATTLAKYLGINQGIPSNNWGLYGFSVTLQDIVNSMLTAAEIYDKFDFKRFLDSVEAKTGYHRNMIAMTSPLFKQANLNFNPLYVLISNPHFAKQLSAFNASNTILRESSYRVNAIYHIVDKLRAIGYLGPNENIQKQDFQEVEKFVESTVIDSFIQTERMNTTNIKERPVFYKGNTPMYLDNPNDRRAFVEWVQNDFFTAISELDTIKGNAFMQDLRIDSKMDPLLFDKVDFMKLQMDTTNVKSNVEQGPFRDAYIAGLKQIYDNGLTDLQSNDPSKDNNIFNVLFWYNLIVNKNNITKNSYAKLLGDVMWANGPSENVYSRLFLLKGKIGKSTKVELNLDVPPTNEDGTPNQEFYKLNIAGINFNLLNLFVIQEVGQTFELPAEGQENFNEGDNISDDYQDYNDNDFSGDDPAGDSSFGDNTSFNEDSGDGGADLFVDPTAEEGKNKPKRNYLTVDRVKQKGVLGTTVTITFNKVAQQYTVASPTSSLPVYTSNGIVDLEQIGYNPFVTKRLEMRPDQTEAYNYFKLSISNIHSLLSQLGEGAEVTITHKGKTEKFDPNKDYEC